MTCTDRCKHYDAVDNNCDGRCPAPVLTDEQRAREFYKNVYTKVPRNHEEYMDFADAYAAHVLSQHRPGVPVQPADCGWTDKE